MRILVCGWLFLSLFLAQGAYSQGENRLFPPRFSGYSFSSVVPGMEGYYFIAPFKSGSDTVYTSSLGLIDAQGDLVWYKQANGAVFDFKYHPKAELFSFAEGDWRGLDSKWYLMNRDFELVDSLAPEGFGNDNHEFLVLENGNYLIGGLSEDTVDCSHLKLQKKEGYGQKNSVVMGYVLQEFTPEGELVFSWNSLDYLPVDESYTEMGYEYKSWRYAQGNSVAEDTDGHFLISFRCLCSVIKVHRKTGEIIWRFGGKKSDFKLMNDAGFSAQHDVRRLPNGNLAMFDNNNLGGAEKRSRAIEYRLDPKSGMAGKVWEYYHPSELHCNAMGSYQQLDNGYKLIDWGNARGDLPTGSLISATDSLIFDFHLSHDYMTYRMNYADLPFDLPRPKVKLESKGLCLEKEHGAYLWSTGAETRDLEPAGAGVYKVWVPQGCGWISSPPIAVPE